MILHSSASPRQAVNIVYKTSSTRNLPPFSHLSLFFKFFKISVLLRYNCKIFKVT